MLILCTCRGGAGAAGSSGRGSAILSEECPKFTESKRIIADVCWCASFAWYATTAHSDTTIKSVNESAKVIAPLPILVRAEFRTRVDVKL